MQRIYGKNDMKEKEYFELRDQPPMSTDRHPDLYRKAASAVHHQQSEPAKAVPTFTIPSSSNIGIEKEEIKSIKPYFPARQAYYQDSYPQQQQLQPQQQPPQEVYTSPRNLHCIVIADHIVDCPICSRFYRNYTPIYNVIILILIIVLIVFIVRSNRGHHHHHPSASAPSIATKPVIATTSSFL